jgi:uncharacterized protein
MNLEHKTLALDSKAGEDGTVELYAAVFGNVDRQGEVIAPGAFSNLPEFVKSGWLALNHEWDDLPLASIEAATQDAKGLRIVARWHNTDDAQACRLVVKERLDRGKAVKCSIGFRTTKDRWDDADGRRVRVLEEIELYEASIVNLPANPLAEVTAAKSLDLISEAYAGLKEGRTLSARNRDRLAKCRDRMKEACIDIDELLVETEPTPNPLDVVKSDDMADDEIPNLFLHFMALRATLPTYEVY